MLRTLIFRSLRTFLLLIVAAVMIGLLPTDAVAAKPKQPRAPKTDQEYSKYAIYANSAPRPTTTDPQSTSLPLKLHKGDRIAFIGNTLLERSQHFGYFEAMLQQHHPNHQLVVRNLTWPADTPDLMPRPANFADVHQHLKHEAADIIIAAFGFNESFAGPDGVDAFHKSLTEFVSQLRASAYNGESAPRVVLLSPIANEDTVAVKAAKNNANIALYTEAVKKVAEQQQVGFIDLFTPTLAGINASDADLTINGSHLNDAGYQLLANAMFTDLFQTSPPTVNEDIRATVIDKNRQYFRRYRPANTFYYTGGRNKSYGYLDFLPAMRNFDIMASNRDERIWALARGEQVSNKVDDSNVPPLPPSKESRGANRWKTAADELKDFTVDPRFDVTLFAGEEEFPDIAAPIQMRWDAQGRLWVSCSTTYPHVYPGNEENDKLVILEDTDGDGKADKSTVFADDLHIPLSFEFGDGGVYVSEMPHLTFIKDTDGDGKADFRRRVLTGFGTEDSHHSLHDITWTPDGDLIFREAIFHHTQVETPYGPVRQQNSGWFRFQPRDQRLLSFGTYHSTNPWGVTFDDWGNHIASHPVFAAAFHSLDPPYPTQHPRPAGLRAYSGTCGQEMVDFSTFPEELQGGFIKVRYKPTNRVEIHRWVEKDFGYDEEYVSDLLFSSNLSFIPVDIRFGPRGAMYVCDWYNPVKGHAQYSLRDERRDRHSGRIWRITTKGKPLQEPPKIADASIDDLLEIMKRPEYRYRYWAKRELRERKSDDVRAALDQWVQSLDQSDPRFRHHQIEAIWNYRNIGESNPALLRQILACDDHHARAAATQQLRYWHSEMRDALKLLRNAANDSSGLVRMEAVIAASYIGSKGALDAMLDATKQPSDEHLAYAITCALGSHTLRKHWEQDSSYRIEALLKKSQRGQQIKEPSPTASEAQFDSQSDLKTVKISCVPERMMYTLKQFAVKTGQPVKVVFSNPDATDHNFVIVKPGALAEVGIAANDMARDPKNANSDFIPKSKMDLIIESSPMIGPTRKSRIHVLRFHAPKEAGIYPFVCTFPGHWIVMKGEIVVADDLNNVAKMLADHRKATIVNEWKMSDFDDDPLTLKDRSVMKGMMAFAKARCNQCHIVAGYGVNLGPNLTDVAKRFKGRKLLQQVLEPSVEINEKYRTVAIETTDGKLITGVQQREDATSIHLIPNLLVPQAITEVPKSKIEERFTSKISMMPAGLANVLTKDEILDLLAYLEAGGYQLPEHLQGRHGHSHAEEVK